MAKLKGSSAFYSLQKYTRGRQLMGRNGFCLAIDANGNVTSTNDESSPHSNLHLLSIGPDLVAICGTQAEKYLAVDEEGNLFATESETKQCVFREFLGKNFYSLFRTCHSDEEGGKNWYLAIDEHGKVTTKNVSISDDPNLHFIVKVLKENQDEAAIMNGCASISHHMDPVWVTNTNVTLVGSGEEPVWVRQGEERDEGISSYTPSPPSSSGVSGSTLSTGEWTGSGDNSYLT